VQNSKWLTAKRTEGSYSTVKVELYVRISPSHHSISPIYLAQAYQRRAGSHIKHIRMDKDVVVESI
jgi:hypothetical protein